ncbi:MAG: hypothetical protein QGH33_18995 [Pirellulaceae bacterium]|nr:hypothetical protein [Pirellulaceae bacterium]HJN12656.1 hypothetical protein [Pirellulaceae bacterium]
MRFSLPPCQTAREIAGLNFPNVRDADLEDSCQAILLTGAVAVTDPVCHFSPDARCARGAA